MGWRAGAYLSIALHRTYRNPLAVSLMVGLPALDFELQPSTSRIHLGGKLALSSDTRLDLRIHLGGKVHACLVESFLDHFATSYSLALDFAALGVPAY